MGWVDEWMDVFDSKMIINMDALKAIIVGFSFFDSDVRKVYDKLKSEDKTINIIFINSRLVYGWDHVFGILKIINEEKKRNIKMDIKNVEIEILLRICYTNQIKDALRANFGDDKNKTFVVVLISTVANKLSNTLDTLRSYGSEDSNLIVPNTRKKDYIINYFFKDKFKNNSHLLLNDEEKCLKFLVEKAAICLN